jgi:hypothetical protein
MHPRIVTARQLLTFNLARYSVRLLVDVQSAGGVQYHHVLSIYKPGGEPCMHFAAEWNTFDPAHKDAPIFGIFNDDKQSFDNLHPECSEIPLFLLLALDRAKVELGLADDLASDGEAWALTEVVNKVQKANDRPDSVRFSHQYREALHRYGDRLQVEPNPCCDY